MEQSEAIEALRKIIKDDYGRLDADLAKNDTFTNHEYSIFPSGSKIVCTLSFTITAKVYLDGEEWTIEIWSSELNSDSTSRLGSVSAGRRRFLNIELQLPSQNLKEMKQEFLHFAQSPTAALILHIRENEGDENGDFSLSQLTFKC